MGEVYKAKDTRLDRTVAIKVLPSHLSDNPELKQRLEREARAISSLNHPHICILYDIQDGVHYLVMEYLEGETRRITPVTVPRRPQLGRGARAVSLAGSSVKASQRIRPASESGILFSERVNRNHR